MLIAQIDQRPFRSVRGEVAKHVLKPDDHIESLIASDKRRGDDLQCLHLIASYVEEKGFALLIVPFALWVDEEVEGSLALDALLCAIILQMYGKRVARF